MRAQVAQETTSSNSNKKDFEIEVENKSDKECTTLHIKGIQQEEYLAILSQALTKLDLFLQVASIKQQDDQFKIKTKDGKQLSEHLMKELKQSLVNNIGSQYSSHPVIYGQHPSADNKQLQPMFQPEEASKLEQAAADMARAATELVAIESQKAQIEKMEKSTGIKYSDRLKEASAILERKIGAMEALIAVRRNTLEQQMNQEELMAKEMEETFQPPPAKTTGPGMGGPYEILLQQFNWESKRGHHWFQDISKQAQQCQELGITVVWLPPCTASVSQEGYLPTDLYNFNSAYGSEQDVRDCIHQYHEHGIRSVADIVINHRCASYQKDGVWNQYGGRLAWDETAICSDNPTWRGRGGRKTGDDYPAAPNVDHTNPKVQQDLIEWLKYLKQLGFDGWRFDYVKGYGGRFVKQYVNGSAPYMAFGEYWDACDYSGGVLAYNQDAHRQRTINWIDDTGGTSAAFDFTTKGILQEAVGKREYWRLVDPQGKPPGVIGMWPSRAVTFIENHDTGSTLNHWPFPYNRLCEGYAYILTHPGTPCVFYDHFWSNDQTLKNSIHSLLKIRKKFGISSQSQVSIRRARSEVYASVIENRVAMKIGPGDWSPPMDQVDVGQKDWKLETSGPQFAVWSAVM